MDEVYLSTEETAEILNTSVQTVIKLIKSKKLYAFRLGRTYRIPNTAIIELRNKGLK